MTDNLFLYTHSTPNLYRYAFWEVLMATLNTLFHEHKKRSLIVSPVETSIFDLLKCGPGPSSSHTIGPMKAGYDFYAYAVKNFLNLPKSPIISLCVYTAP